MIPRFLIFMAFVCACISAGAQERIRQAPCYDSTLKRQVDSLKESLSKEGFVMVREASMEMESEYEMPVIVPLNQGSWYQFAFLGEPSSRLYELRMFDQNEKQVVYKKQFGEGVESNIINFSYIPRFNEYHMIRPLQINKKKKKNLCGYILMFKKVT